MYSSPENSYFKIIPSQVHCYVILLHQVTKGKRDGGGGGNGRQTLLFGSLAGMMCIVISPSRNTSHHNWVPLSGMAWRVSASSWLDLLAPAGSV